MCSFVIDQSRRSIAILHPGGETKQVSAHDVALEVHRTLATHEGKQHKSLAPTWASNMNKRGSDHSDRAQCMSGERWMPLSGWACRFLPKGCRLDSRHREGIKDFRCSNATQSVFFKVWLWPMESRLQAWRLSVVVLKSIQDEASACLWLWGLYYEYNVSFTLSGEETWSHYVASLTLNSVAQAGPELQVLLPCTTTLSFLLV